MLTRVLRTVRLNTIDGRSQVGVALRRIRQELADQLGGLDAVSPAQLLLIEQAAVKAVITQAVGGYILRQECPVKGEALVNVVMQHDQLQRTLAGLLKDVGLERRARPVPSLTEYLAQRATTEATTP